MTRSRVRAVVMTVASLALAGGLAVTAGAASAHTVGGAPTGIPTGDCHQQGSYGHDCRPKVELRPVQFDLTLADDYADGNSYNDVSVEGPGHRYLFGSDRQITGMLDDFADNRGDSIDVWHTASLGTPVVDLAVCEVRFTLPDAYWRFVGGTGDYDHATGHGLFSLVADFSFAQDRRGRCELEGLGLYQIQQVIQGGSDQVGGVYNGTLRGTEDNGIAAYCHEHHIPVPVLLADDIFVQGRGVAAVREHRDDNGGNPYPTPSVTTPAPYATPTSSAVADGSQIFYRT